MERRGSSVIETEAPVAPEHRRVETWQSVSLSLRSISNKTALLINTFAVLIYSSMRTRSDLTARCTLQVRAELVLLRDED